MKTYLSLKKKDGNSAQITDEDLKNARNNLPIAPMGFMAWAKDGGFYNDKITGNPGRVAGAMQTTLLQNAGYDIPNVTELNDQNSTLQVGINKNIESQSQKTLAEKELEVMGRNIIYKKKGSKVETSGTSETGELKKKAIEGRDYEILPDGTIWDLLHGMKRDSIDDVYKFMPVTSQTSSKVKLFGDEGKDHPGLSNNMGEPEHTDQDKLFIKNIKGASTNIPDLYGAATNEANALREYDGRQRYNQPDEVQVAVCRW